MRKRRVLALFLALSMALSSNGFTALAAGEDPLVSIQADSLEEADETESGMSEGDDKAVGKNDESKENESGVSDGSGDTNSGTDTSDGSSDVGSGTDASDGNAGSGTDASGENGGAGTETGATDGNGEVGAGTDTSDGNGEAGGGTGASDGNDAADVSDGSDAEENGDDADTPSETDGAETDTDIEAAESVEDVQVDGEGTADNKEVRLRTFTDETGMVVTYDMNESEDYIYKVTPNPNQDPDQPLEHYVLTGIYEMVNGVETPVELSEVIKLREPGEDDDFFDTIGAGVFQGNTEIEYVILPENVKYIEAGAFKGCTKLRGITLPSGLKEIQNSTFEGCTKLTQLSIPKGVTSIGDNAFKSDSNLFMVYIKDSTYCSMLTIGDSAFEDCKRLEKFGSDTDFVLPGNLTTIGDKAFMNCYAIKKVTLPDSVKEYEKRNEITNEVEKDADGNPIMLGGLGTSVFESCIGLTDVVLSGVSNIPDNAFKNCSNLLSVKFANGNKTIGNNAFEKCIRLSEVIFSNTIDTVGEYAFDGCSNLRYVEIPNANMKPIPSDKRVFPNNNEYTLWMRGFEGTEVEKYAKAHNNIQFIAYKDNSSEYFQYAYQCLTTDVAGTVKFFCEDKTTDPNAKNGNKGVKAGAKIYVSVIGSSSVKLTEGSLRCNGTPIAKDKDDTNFYTFTMPVGGAYVTAEFERTGKGENQNTLGSGDDIVSELSNGSDLKVGQTTRMFLIDTSPQAGDSVIAYSKIKFTTSNKTIATVSDDGTIKALKEGRAYITAEVHDGSGKSVTREASITITHADVVKLRLRPFSYDADIIKPDLDSDLDYTGVFLNKADVENKETTFTILATAYDDIDDNMSVALNWTTSDAKVAKIGSKNTTASEPQNTITIPKGASGEAVITATATNANPEEEHEKKVTKKFIIRVQDPTPRLAASTLTLNTYKEEGAVLEIIGAYTSSIDVDKVKLMKNDNKDNPSLDFILGTYNWAEDDDNDRNSVARFTVTARDTDLPDGTYKVSVSVEVDDNQYNLPLNIKVKRSIPNPKVKISKKQPKLNLFYKNGGVVQKDGTIAAGEVIPEITNLGDLDEGDIRYSLHNLSNSGDNAKFTDNFQIEDNTECIITRTENKMASTSNAKSKPIVTGILRLEFDGYKPGVNYREYKITIPTKTTKPAYKLERTSDTFKSGGDTQNDVYITLKEGKKIVNLAEEGWEVYKDAEGSTSSAVTIDPNDFATEDGRIKLSVNPKAGAGKAVIAIHNEEWDDNQVVKLNYKAKISSKKTVFKLSKSSVTLNKCFSDTPATVTLKSNQYGVTATDGDAFEPPAKLSEAKEEEYSKVSFSFNGDTQEVTVSVDPDIKAGTYRFTCKPLGDEGNKVTLAVRVVGVAPKLTIKGTAKININANGADTAELSMTFKNRPTDAKLEECTIESVLKREDDEDVSGNFEFKIDDEHNKLRITLLPNTDLSAKTYTFKMTPIYTNYKVDAENAKSTKFKVRLYKKEISVSLRAKGRINLLERYNDTYFEDLENANSPTVDTDVPTVESLSMVEEGDYAAVVDGDAVPSFDEGDENNNNGTEEGGGTTDPGTTGSGTETGSGDGTSNDLDDPSDPSDPTDPTDPTEPTEDPDDSGDTPAVDTTTTLPVNYVIGNTGHVTPKLYEVVTGESGEETKTEITDTSIVVDASGKPTKTYKIVATADEGYEVISINAYKSDSKDEDDNWINPLVLGDAATGTLTIATTDIFSSVVEAQTGITVVITSQPDNNSPSDPNPDPTETHTHTVTLSKPSKGVESLGYTVINDVSEIVSYTSVDTSAEIDSITSENIIAVKLVASEGYVIDENSFTATVAGEEAELTVEKYTPSTGGSTENGGEEPDNGDDGDPDEGSGNEPSETLNANEDGTSDAEETYLITGISADTTITITPTYNAGKSVEFVTDEVGDGTEIKKLNADGITFDDISEEEKTTDEGYTFVVSKLDGKVSDIDVTVYATEDYRDDSNQTDPTLIASPDGVEIADTNAMKYTIALSDINSVSEGGITIVITESYEVTITDNTKADGTSKINTLQYKITNGNDAGTSEGGSTDNYNTYSDATKPLVKPNEKLSLQFEIPDSDIEANETIVVKATYGNPEKVTTIAELTSNDGVNGLYTVENIEIPEDTTITISIETQQTVTLPKLADLTGKVRTIQYAMLDTLDSVETLTAADFTACPADSVVTYSGDKYLALIVTLEDGYTVKSFANEVTSDDGNDEEPLGYEKKEVNGLGTVYRLNDKITDGMVISMAVATSYTVTFNKVGPATGGAKIMKADGTTEIALGADHTGTDSVAEGEDYKFVTDEVVIATASYTNEDGETETVTVENELPHENGGWEYTIQAKNIKGNINIVVTDAYEITISNDAHDIVPRYKYTVGSKTFDPYALDSDHVVYVPYDQGNMSISLPSVVDKRVLLTESLFDGSKKVLEPDTANADSTATDPDYPVVYTISNVTADKQLTISQAFKVRDEITSTDNRDNTAKIEYDTNVIKNDSGSEMYVLKGESLGFKVTPVGGYAHTVKVNDAADPLTAVNSATAETDGYYRYTISGGGITEDIAIKVETDRKDKDNNIVKFNIVGATVEVDGEGTVTDWKREIPVENPTEEQKTFKFKVTKDSDKLLRYVGTDKALKAASPEITGPDSDGFYTFTLPADPDPEITIYVSATASGQPVNITFTGWQTNDSQPVPMADIRQVVFDSDYANNKKITTTAISGGIVNDVTGDSDFYFIVIEKEGYTLSGVTKDNAAIPSDNYEVYENGSTTLTTAHIYKLTLTDQDVTVKLTLSSGGLEPVEPVEPEAPKYPYDPKSCIIYTPVVANLKDTINEARIYDASGKAPAYEDEQSSLFDIKVVDGLLYVMPKKDSEDPDAKKLKSNTVYPVKIWLKFANYDSGVEEDGGGIWVKKTMKIKTAQVLPKITASTNTINLYQSNTAYKASFILRLKDKSVGKFKTEDPYNEDVMARAVIFGEKDTKAWESLKIEKTEVRSDGSLKVTVTLKPGALYASNSNNKVKMYVKFENQADNTLGTAFTMNVKVNK